MSWQFLYEGRDQTQSTQEESFRREFFLPLVDTAIGSLNDRFSKLEDFYALYGFLFSKDNMREAMRNSGQLEENCKKLERALHDIHSENLVMEIMAAVHTFPDQASTSPRVMLDYIYKEQLLDLYGNLSIALRLLLTLPVTVASGERSFSALKLIKTSQINNEPREALSTGTNFH